MSNRAKRTAIVNISFTRLKYLRMHSHEKARILWHVSMVSCGAKFSRQMIIVIVATFCCFICT